MKLGLRPSQSLLPASDGSLKQKIAHRIVKTAFEQVARALAQPRVGPNSSPLPRHSRACQHTGAGIQRDYTLSNDILACMTCILYAIIWATNRLPPLPIISIQKMIDNVRKLNNTIALASKQQADIFYQNAIRSVALYRAAVCVCVCLIYFYADWMRQHLLPAFVTMRSL